MSPDWRAVRPRTLAAAVAGLALFACAACGSGSGSSGGTAAAGGKSQTAAVAAAKTALAQYTTRPTALPITTPVGKAIPTGKRIDFILCGVQSCKDLADYFTAGASALGWRVNEIATQGTPQSVQAGWNQAVRDKPDAVVAGGFERSVFATQLAQLKAMNIPVIESSTADTVGDGITMLIDGPQVVGVEGRIMAAWTAVDSGGSADTVYFDLPTYSILKPVADEFKSNYATYCPGCKLDVVDVPITAIGNDMPDRVVSYLRAHPGVNHIAFSLGLMDVGVPAALRAAGLQKSVHTVSNIGSTVNYQYIASGQSEAAVAFNNQENAWTQVDALARIFTGQSPAVDQNAQLPFMLITKDNLISTSTDFPLIADYQEQFKKLWGKG